VKIPTNVPFNPVTLKGSLIVAPAERPDIIIDFSAHTGQSVILYNDAPAPFPVGDPRNDYFPLWNAKGNPVNALTPNGFGPNSRVLMKFDVVPATSADAPLTITTTTNLQAGNDPLLVPVGVTTPPPGVFVRPLTLNETFDPYGRLQQLLGTNVPLKSAGAGFGRAYIDPATEVVRAGSTEVWEIYNTTADVHPMHFHLVNVQVINRTRPAGRRRCRCTRGRSPASSCSSTCPRCLLSCLRAQGPAVMSMYGTAISSSMKSTT
jgi:spore coat protein A